MFLSTLFLWILPLREDLKLFNMIPIPLVVVLPVPEGLLNDSHVLSKPSVEMNLHGLQILYQSTYTSYMTLMTSSSCSPSPGNVSVRKLKPKWWTLACYSLVSFLLKEPNLETLIFSLSSEQEGQWIKRFCFLLDCILQEKNMELRKKPKLNQ